MTETNDWLAGYEAKIAEMQRRSAMLTESFQAAGATAASPDGAVRVKVGPTGAFEQVQLSPGASRYAPAELAGIINRTAAEAMRTAAHQARAAFAEFAGGTEALDLVDSFLPPPAEPVSEAPEDGLEGLDEIEEPPKPPTPPTPPVAPPAHRPPSSAKKDDDDDFDQPW